MVHGWAATNRPTNPLQGDEYFCVAGWNGGTCGAENQPIEIASETFTVPASHDGIVYFSARVRAQGDPADGAGDVLLWIEIDGIQAGSHGVQQLGGAGNSVSQRSLCASYLATGANALAQGNHVVKLFARVNSIGAPGFRHLGMHNDRPLIVWID